MLINTTVVPFTQCPAKTYKNELAQMCLGFNVYDHTYIVGLVARELINQFPDLVKVFFPAGSELVAACHDIGKVSPTFYLRLTRPVHPLSDFNGALIQLFDHLKDNENSAWGGHATVSAATLKDCIKDKYIYKIVGSHHGSLFKNIKRYHGNDEIFGGDVWNQERLSLITALKHRLNCDFPTLTTDTQARLLSGLTTVADWIGSGGKFSVPYDDWESTLEHDIQQTVKDAGFTKFTVRPDLSFSDVFGPDYLPNLMQSRFFKHAEMNALNFIEAPMGMGKTEAALYFAYKCLEAGQANGIYFALPTQLTSNKIHDRFNAFLSNVLEDDAPKSKLLHSNAWLLDTNMGEEGTVGRSWFDGAKRGLLAPFAVGTIDQALLSVINVRHHFVRSLGLMGKVVILDELHSYDVYTSLIIDELIKHLLEMKCTVIVLSATLTSERKQELLPSQVEISDPVYYPSITRYSPTTTQIECFDIPVTTDIEKKINIILSDGESAYLEALKRAAQGEYVLWIENTVDEAIEVYKTLSALGEEYQIRTGLLHSRFTVEDRHRIEQEWVGLFGKHHPDRLNGIGHILVGTQILEQSLDIDADYLITRIAPIDFLMQRSGRLWRHPRPNRPSGAICEMRIITPSFDEAALNPYDCFKGTAFVYAPFILLSTLKVLKQYLNNTNVLSIPQDIPHLINAVYTSTSITTDPILKPYYDDLVNGNKYMTGLNQLKTLARANLAKTGSVLNDNYIPQTRYIENTKVPLLLLSSIEFTENGDIEFIKFLNGEIIKKISDTNSKEATVKLINNICFINLKININELKKHNKPKQLDNIYSLYDKLLICVVTHSQVTLINGEPLSDKYNFTYNPKIGLVKRPV
ncbi:CRISPR-associated helicase Cas3' [Acinetobacter variabilis]|uniref:CRISPR-associated helicase Cas3' n=1 Tax=Acinetobacter variabilis TaxID=70346 RepID=UPI003B83F6F1